MKAKKTPYPGVGMPAALYLDEFGSQVWHAFGDVPYLVGSALMGKGWRDVDVRLILADEDYAAAGYGDPRDPHANGKWCAMVAAFSELGRRMTGLPIDFQIQSRTLANEQYSVDGGHFRSALAHVDLRIAKPNITPQTEVAPEVTNG